MFLSKCYLGVTVEDSDCTSLKLQQNHVSADDTKENTKQGIFVFILFIITWTVQNSTENIRWLIRSEKEITTGSYLHTYTCITISE